MYTDRQQQFGCPYLSTDQPKQTASAVLKLAGLDPNGYDLGEIRPGQADPKVYEDEQPVHKVHKEYQGHKVQQVNLVLQMKQQLEIQILHQYLKKWKILLYR